MIEFAMVNFLLVLLFSFKFVFGAEVEKPIDMLRKEQYAAQVQNKSLNEMYYIQSIINTYNQEIIVAEDKINKALEVQMDLYLPSFLAINSDDVSGDQIAANRISEYRNRLASAIITRNDEIEKLKFVYSCREQQYHFFSNIQANNNKKYDEYIRQLSKLTIEQASMLAKSKHEHREHLELKRLSKIAVEQASMLAQSYNENRQRLQSVYQNKLQEEMRYESSVINQAVTQSIDGILNQIETQFFIEREAQIALEQKILQEEQDRNVMIEDILQDLIEKVSKNCKNRFAKKRKKNKNKMVVVQAYELDNENESFPVVDSSEGSEYCESKIEQCNAYLKSLTMNYDLLIEAFNNCTIDKNLQILKTLDHVEFDKNAMLLGIANTITAKYDYNVNQKKRYDSLILQEKLINSIAATIQKYKQGHYTLEQYRQLLTDYNNQRSQAVNNFEDFDYIHKAFTVKSVVTIGQLFMDGIDLDDDEIKQFVLPLGNLPADVVEKFSKEIINAGKGKDIFNVFKATARPICCNFMQKTGISEERRNDLFECIIQYAYEFVHDTLVDKYETHALLQQYLQTKDFDQLEIAMLYNNFTAEPLSIYEGLTDTQKIDCMKLQFLLIKSLSLHNNVKDFAK